MSATWATEAGKASVRLNGTQNVILRFDEHGGGEPLQWGFATVREWRSFLKFLLRCDEELGFVSPEPIDEGDRGY